MKYFAYILVLIILGAPQAVADQYKITVNGMVCSFCSQGVKKHLAKLPTVEKTSIEVDLEQKRVQFSASATANISDADIKQAIKNAGLVVTEIERIKKTPPRDEFKKSEGGP